MTVFSPVGVVTVLSTVRVVTILSPVGVVTVLSPVGVVTGCFTTCRSGDCFITCPSGDYFITCPSGDRLFYYLSDLFFFHFLGVYWVIYTSSSIFLHSLYVLCIVMMCQCANYSFCKKKAIYGSYDGLFIRKLLQVHKLDTEKSAFLWALHYINMFLLVSKCYADLLCCFPVGVWMLYKQPFCCVDVGM